MGLDKSNRRKIESLQALRAIAFLGIFFEHAGTPFRWSALGVSVFFVLSGFLMVYKHENDELDCSLKGRLSFSLERIKKLYPLHILTMFFAVILQLWIIINEGLDVKSLLELLGKIALNVTLLQTWFPYGPINVSLNGVAWYLSVTVFLYFMFPCINRFIKTKAIKSLWSLCLLILLVQCISCMPFLYFLGSGNHVYDWFNYCFPIFRLGDFFIGCVLGKSYTASANIIEISTVRISVIEILATIGNILVWMWLKIEQHNLVLLSLQNGATIYIPFAAIWVYLFALKKGVVTRFLSNRFSIFIGNISAYAFLIHFVITKYTLYVLRYFNIELPTLVFFFLVFIELVVTIAATLFYKKLRGEKVKF